MVGADLYFVKNTGSGHVEIHSATAASGYQAAGQHSVTWFLPVGGGGYVTHTRCVPLRAEEFYAGRWHSPQVVVGALPAYPGARARVLAYPAPATLFVNGRGQAAIVCSAVDSFGFSFGYVASFEF